MRDVMMFAAMLALVPLAFANSFNAFLLWGWTALLSPNFYLFGFMQGLRYNLIFAAIALSLWTLGKLEVKGKFSANSTTVLLLAFTMQVTLSACFGYDGNPWNWDVYENFVKSVGFALLIPVFVSSRLRIHAFVLIVCLALGFHGVVEGLKVLGTAGGHRVSGIPTSMMSDNNHFAVGMCMVIPIFLYLINNLRDRVVRAGAVVGLCLTVLAVVGTNSRGGFLCIAVLAVWYALTSRRKIAASVLVFMLAFLALQLAPDSWFQRMESIKSAEQDYSFMGRVVAWKISTAIGFENPIFGGGIHAVQAAPVWQVFMNRIEFLSFIPTPQPGFYPRAAHSIYFEILGDLGVLGLTLFLGLIVNAFITVRRIRRLVINRPELLWARDLSDSLKLALVAYCVGGAAVSLGYFDLFYVITMLIEALRQHVKISIAKQENEEISKHLASAQAIRVVL